MYKTLSIFLIILKKAVKFDKNALVYRDFIDFDFRRCYILSTEKSANNSVGKEAKMEATIKSRRKLDFSKLSFSGRVLSSAEALKDVVPMEWSDEVKSGAKKATIFHSSISDKQVND